MAHIVHYLPTLKADSPFLLTEPSFLHPGRPLPQPQGWSLINLRWSRFPKFTDICFPLQQQFMPMKWEGTSGEEAASGKMDSVVKKRAPFKIIFRVPFEVVVFAGVLYAHLPAVCIAFPLRWPAQGQKPTHWGWRKRKEWVWSWVLWLNCFPPDSSVRKLNAFID